MIKVEKAFTHGGRFHADDVFSAALLTILNPELQIERGFQVPEDYDGIVFDIGFGAFDHHQADKEIRENGIPYAAFGLLWREFGTELLSEEQVKRFDEKFVQPIDLSDNTGEKNDISDMISSFNPSWSEKLDGDLCFHKAKEFAVQILMRKFQYYKDEEKADEIVEEAMKNADGEILILPQFVPWKNKVVGTSIQFVVFQSMRGGFNAQAVPKTEESPELLVPFPESWRGKSGNELQLESGIDDLTFCHASGFLIAADTLEGAKKACLRAMNEGL